MKRYFLSISVLISINSVFSQNVDVIISNTQKQYQNAETYFDSGKVVSSFYDVPHQFSNAKLFKTAYSNTGLFNFEYYELGNGNSLYVINRNKNKKVQSWWGVLNSIKTYGAIVSPLSAATGVSSLTSVLIPELLLPNDQLPGKNIFQSLFEPVLAGMEVVNGDNCYKIAGHDNLKGTTEIWISKKSFYIRKIAIVKQVKDFKVKSIYQFFPYHLNGVPDALFAFRPNREIEL